VKNGDHDGKVSTSSWPPYFQTFVLAFTMLWTPPE